MKPTNELIWALRRAAKRILDPKEGYSWCVPDSCNCGILVREICGLGKEELQKLRWESKIYGWGNYKVLPDLEVVELQCTKTDLPMSFVFQTLADIGFEPQDYHIIEQAGSSPKTVHDFFLTLADKLELELHGTVCIREGDIVNNTLPTRRAIVTINNNNKVNTPSV